ncbi:hypothetical protein N431DRAFT_492075 [Stipitochalara longipes BDJ]|nr:hypothetical protein N431DRAFT_492075 [Stipitochalara longipes BDJ]
MFSYQYLPLPTQGNYIRLLRLLPNEDEAAPIQCELRKYSLQYLGLRTHLYEALSYVWGDARDTLPIYVDQNRFPVTKNLHAALSRLRDHSLERTMWGQQVQLMAKIYSNALRVIVWLGEETVETKGALEDIRLAANEEHTEGSEKKIKQQTVLNLLQTPWFDRIWVLQEVAAARHVLMKCGTMEIEGYTFCLGVKSLNLPYMASPALQTLPSVIYLIERAGLRSKYTANLPERSPLEIRSLAELLDMFHTRQATDPRDNVYALLGMSSDDPGKAGLQPNYQVPWEELFKNLVKFNTYTDVGTTATKK